MTWPEFYAAPDTKHGHNWRDDALCAQIGPGVFYIEKGPNRCDDYSAAKAICAECPVSGECLADAMERDDRFGVWGGSTPDERAAMRRERA